MNNDQIKKNFPLLTSSPDFVYLDSAATSQKPQAVIEAISFFYNKKNANVHRGIYSLAEEATNLYESSRKKMQEFIKASFIEEVIFTRNATEAINLVAMSFSQKSRILISAMEHHANIVPWHMVSAEIEVVKLTSDYRFDMEDFKKKLETFQPDLVALSHVSNVLGTINPVREIIQLAHEAGAVVLIDGAQAVSHIPIDVKDLNVDFYAFSAHKMFGPTGIGVLYGKQKLLCSMEPVFGGGEMIRSVDFTRAEWNDLPWKFEPGTPPIAEAIGLAAAVDYLHSIGFDTIKTQLIKLGEYALERFREIEELRVWGPATMVNRSPVFSCTIDGVHAHDVASLLDQDNIAVRAGHHCAMPLHTEILKIPATVRASFSIYNSKEDVDSLVLGLNKVIKKFT